MDVIPRFGELLKRHREARALTQGALSDASGVSKRAISNLERGKNKRPRVDTKQMLGAALGLTGIDRERFLRWPAEPISPPSPVHRPHNLPHDLPEFIGREREVPQVRGLIRQHRLVALTGTGGCGKTRLAIAAAEGLRGEFPDGIHFVDLAPLRDPALVASAIARVLGVRESGRLSPEEHLIAHLKNKSLLLLLDNFEHLLPAAPLAQTLLARSPGLRVLVTSRKKLGQVQELPFLVPPLDLPARNQAPVPQVLIGYAGIALFASRARFARQGVPLPVETLPTVLDICRALDGLPLAIELAAARCAILSPAEILDRLGSRLSLLTRGQRGPARHRTLQAALAWSYELLEPGVQTLFRRLAVFAGGCTLEAVEQVCNPHGDLGIVPLDGLHELVQQNLLRAATNEQEKTRYTLLETIREYAAAHLKENQDAVYLHHDLHASYYVAIASRADPSIGWFEDVDALVSLDREQDNLRAAMRWLLDNGHGERSLNLGGAMVWFWQIRGPWREGRQLLEAALRVGATASPELRTKVLTRLGNLATTQGDLAAARAIHESSLAISQSIGDMNRIANSLNSIGNASWPSGDLTAAINAFTEGLSIYRALSDKRGVLMCQHNLGEVLMHQGDFVAARRNIEGSVALLRELGQTRSIAESLIVLAEVATYQGDYRCAEASLSESLGIYQSFEDRLGLANNALHRATLALYQGDVNNAKPLYGESLLQHKSLEVEAFVAAAMEGSAACQAMCDQYEEAARLWGHAAKVRHEAGTPILPAAHIDYAARTHVARTALGSAAFDAAWARGEALSLDDAIAEAEHWLTIQVRRDTA